MNKSLSNNVNFAHFKYKNVVKFTHITQKLYTNTSKYVLTNCEQNVN